MGCHCCPDRHMEANPHPLPAANTQRRQSKVREQRNIRNVTMVCFKHLSLKYLLIEVVVYKLCLKPFLALWV